MSKKEEVLKALMRTDRALSDLAVAVDKADSSDNVYEEETLPHDAAPKLYEKIVKQLNEFTRNVEAAKRRIQRSTIKKEGGR